MLSSGQNLSKGVVVLGKTLLGCWLAAWLPRQQQQSRMLNCQLNNKACGHPAVCASMSGAYLWRH
jgi:hypothetical protein